MNESTRCVPKMPSMMISSTSMLMMTKPAYTMMCRKPAMGRTTILLWPSATRVITAQRSGWRSLITSSFPRRMLRRTRMMLRAKSHDAAATSTMKMMLPMPMGHFFFSSSKTLPMRSMSASLNFGSRSFFPKTLK